MSLGRIQEIFQSGVTSADISYLQDIENADELLAEINMILAVVRTYAIDDETHFHGAAIVRTVENRYYIGVNLQTGEAIERFCAERIAINDALRDNRNSRIRQMWFMGGQGFENNDSPPISAGKEGECNSPCGSCLQLINDTATEGIKLHLLPLNDGTQQVTYDDNQLISYNIAELFPQPVQRIADDNGSLVKQMSQALEYFAAQQPIEEISRLDRVGQLLQLKVAFDTQSKQFVGQINCFMVAELKRVCASKVAGIRTASIAIIRTQDGEFFAGSNIHSRVQSSTPSSIFVAIANATTAGHNPRLTDIWKMKIDFENLPQQLEQFLADKYIELPLLRGDERERVKKFGAKNHSGQPSVNIHIIPLNMILDESISPQALGIITTDITALLPAGFNNPKGKLI